MSTRDVAKILGISVSQVIRHCQDGRLPHYDLNHGEKKHAHYRFTETHLQEYLSNAEKKKGHHGGGQTVKPRYVGRI